MLKSVPCAFGAGFTIIGPMRDFAWAAAPAAMTKKHQNQDVLKEEVELPQLALSCNVM